VIGLQAKVEDVGCICGTETSPDPSNFLWYWTLTKPHHEGEAYINLANTTEWKTACIAVSHRPHSWRGFREYKAIP